MNDKNLEIHRFALNDKFIYRLEKGRALVAASPQPKLSLKKSLSFRA